MRLRPQVVFLAGEPGIGKTQLATELALAAHADGATVLLGTCAEDLAVPYEPFVEALGHLAAGLTDSELAEHLGGGADLARVLPDLAARLPGPASPQSSDPDTERYALFATVAGLFASASRTRPILLLLDDVHWATKPTVLMLRHLLRAAEPMSLLAICTYRDTDVGRSHPLAELLADLRRDQAGVARLALRGLSDAEGIRGRTARGRHRTAPPRPQGRTARIRSPVLQTVAPDDRVDQRHVQGPTRPRTPRRAHPGRGLGPRRPTSPGPDRRDLAQRPHRPARQALATGLRPLRALGINHLGPAAYDLGLLTTTLGRYDDAEPHFADALAAQERLPAPVAAIHTRLSWARMLLRRGDAGEAARASALLDAARLGAQSADLPALVARIDAAAVH